MRTLAMPCRCLIFTKSWVGHHFVLSLFCLLLSTERVTLGAFHEHERHFSVLQLAVVSESQDTRS